MPDTLLILAQTPPDSSAFWVAIIAAVGAAVAVVLSALSQVFMAIIQARANVKLAEISARTQKIESETEQQTVKIDEAAKTRHHIAVEQSRQIGELGKSGPQEVVVTNTEPIAVDVENDGK